MLPKTERKVQEEEEESEVDDNYDPDFVLSNSDSEEEEGEEEEVVVKMRGRTRTRRAATKMHREVVSVNKQLKWHLNKGNNKHRAIFQRESQNS